MTKQKPNSSLKSADMQGEGNYKAAKEYDDATSNFVKAGKVGAAVREAKPKNNEEKREMTDLLDSDNVRCWKPKKKAALAPKRVSKYIFRNPTPEQITLI